MTSERPLWLSIKAVDLLTPAGWTVIRRVYLCLQVSVDPLALRRLSVSMFQLNFHVIQISLHLLPQTNGFAAAADLCLQAGLHRLQGALVAPPGGQITNLGCGKK